MAYLLLGADLSLILLLTARPQSALYHDGRGWNPADRSDIAASRPGVQDIGGQDTVEDPIFPVVARVEEAMVTDTHESVGLAAALEGLREDLETAWVEGADRAVRFRVSEVTLTLEAVARREAEGGGKVRWWVVEAGGGGKVGTEATQTLVLKLTPGIYDEQGQSGPLDVAADQAAPGG